MKRAGASGLIDSHSTRSTVAWKVPAVDSNRTRSVITGSRSALRLEMKLWQGALTDICWVAQRLAAVDDRLRLGAGVAERGDLLVHQGTFGALPLRRLHR